MFPASMFPAKVLVAEDDAEMRWLVVRALRRDGYEVIEVVDGDHLQIALTTRIKQRGVPDIDLIVTDVRMPGRSGLEVVELLRAVASRVPVIVMTAFGDQETKMRACAAGAVFFDKPFELKELRIAARELLHRRAASS